MTTISTDYSINMSGAGTSRTYSASESEEPMFELSESQLTNGMDNFEYTGNSNPKSGQTVIIGDVFNKLDRSGLYQLPDQSRRAVESTVRTNFVKGTSEREIITEAQKVLDRMVDRETKLCYVMSKLDWSSMARYQDYSETTVTKAIIEQNVVAWLRDNTSMNKDQQLMKAVEYGQGQIDSLVKTYDLRAQVNGNVEGNIKYTEKEFKTYLVSLINEDVRSNVTDAEWEKIFKHVQLPKVSKDLSDISSRGFSNKDKIAKINKELQEMAMPIALQLENNLRSYLAATKNIVFSRPYNN